TSVGTTRAANSIRCPASPASSSRGQGGRRKITSAHHLLWRELAIASFSGVYLAVLLVLLFCSDILQRGDDGACRNTSGTRSGVATSSTAIPRGASYVNVCPLDIVSDKLCEVRTSELHAAFALGVDIADIGSLRLNFFLVLFQKRNSPGVFADRAAEFSNAVAELIRAHDTGGAGAQSNHLCAGKRCGFDEVIRVVLAGARDGIGKH